MIEKSCKLLLALFICGITVFFTGCANFSPEINSTYYSVVFEYDSLKAYPQARLNVFIDSNSEIRKFENIQFKCNSNEYQWFSKDLIRFQWNNKKYVGMTNILMPQNKHFVTGTYTLTAQSFDSQLISRDINVSYNEKLYKTKGSDVEAFMKNNQGKLKIIIYDNSNKLIYYGERKTELSDNEKILSKYKDAECFYEIWSTQNDQVLCIMPVVELNANK